MNFEKGAIYNNNKKHQRFRKSLTKDMPNLYTKITERNQRKPKYL